jgi:hypothetical protein
MTRKKPSYPINPLLRKFLKHYGREAAIDVQYSDLLRYTNAFPLMDRYGKDSLWESVIYASTDAEHLQKALTGIYALLKTGGDLSVVEHLSLDRIDYCTFGNSNPFRIRIKNNYNDNYDYFYIKLADASRVYGLELEHILSPNRISYFVNKQTLIEEHIIGIPGDMFIKNNLADLDFNAVRLAKEFVKFNERCFVRLLGDMRSYNYVVDVTPDFEDIHYRLRAIDFDQQSYEGRKNLYLPQYFKENNQIVDLCVKLMTPETIRQYQSEEHTLIAKRIKAARYMVKDLLDAMMADPLSEKAKIESLAEELSGHYQSKLFLRCKTMGALVKTSLKVILQKNKAHFKTKNDFLKY